MNASVLINFSVLNNKSWGGGGWVGSGGVGLGSRFEGGQAGCERRIEVFVKIKKKKNFLGGVGLGLGGGVGLRGGGSGWM